MYCYILVIKYRVKCSRILQKRNLTCAPMTFRGNAELSNSLHVRRDIYQPIVYVQWLRERLRNSIIIIIIYVWIYFDSRIRFEFNNVYNILCRATCTEKRSHYIVRRVFSRTKPTARGRTSYPLSTAYLAAKTPFKYFSCNRRDIIIIFVTYTPVQSKLNRLGARSRRGLFAVVTIEFLRAKVWPGVLARVLWYFLRSIIEYHD